MTHAAAAGMHQPGGVFAALADRSFRFYAAGNLVSQCGTWCCQIALSLLVYDRTGSSLLVGAVNFCQFAGSLALGPIAGVLSDRVDRRTLLIVCETGAAIVAGFQVVVVRAPLGVLFTCALVLGVFQAFAAPAQQSLPRFMVPTHHLPSALRLTSVTYNGARVIGPPLGGLAVLAGGYAFAFAINAASFAIFVLCLVVLTIESPPHPRGPVRVRDSLNLISGVAGGWRVMVAVAGISAAIDPIVTLTPGLVREEFRAAPWTVSLLTGVFGVGAVSAGAVRLRGHVLSGAAMTAAVLGCGIAALSLAPGVPVAGIALAVAGFGFLAASTQSQIWLQTVVPDEHIGRAVAVWSTFFLGIRPIVALINGAIADAIGARPAVAIASLPAFAAAVLCLQSARRSTAMP